MSQTRRFIQCDVFTATPTKGNALAVVIDADGLSDEEMQDFARWTNLAETTFLLPPTTEEADYKVRIFTPTREMLFAGHPTLGSCSAWLETGGQPKDPTCVKQECGVGIVDIELADDGQMAFAAPPTDIRPMRAEERARIQDRLGLNDAQILRCAELENGPVWQAFELDSAESVLAMDSSLVAWPEFKAIGLIGRHPEGSECDYEVRMLAPSSGMSEDPITGSLNAAVACWFQADSVLKQPYRVAQGSLIDRVGRVSVTPTERGAILIGGEVHTLISGTVLL